MSSADVSSFRCEFKDSLPESAAVVRGDPVQRLGRPNLARAGRTPRGRWDRSTLANELGCTQRPAIVLPKYLHLGMRRWLAEGAPALIRRLRLRHCLEHRLE